MRYSATYSKILFSPFNPSKGYLTQFFWNPLFVRLEVTNSHHLLTLELSIPYGDPPPPFLIPPSLLPSCPPSHSRPPSSSSSLLIMVCSPESFLCYVLAMHLYPLISSSWFAVRSHFLCYIPAMHTIKMFKFLKKSSNWGASKSIFEH